MHKRMNNEVTEIRKKRYRGLDRNVIILARKFENCETYRENIQYEMCLLPKIFTELSVVCVEM